MAVEGKGEVSACGHESIGIGDLGFRDDVTGASVSEEEAEVFSEGEDIMVGVSGADVFFDGIYGPDEQEDVVVRDEEELDSFEICIDEALEIKDGEENGLYEVRESAGAGSDEIVSCVRALVQSLPLPGQMSPQELIPVNHELYISKDSFEETKDDGISQPMPVVKRKHESIDVKQEEHGISFKKDTDVSCSSMPSRFQEFEDFLIESTKYSTADKMISQLQMPAQTREEDQNKNLLRQLSEVSKTEVAGHSGCESSLVSPVKDVKDSYWPDMVIQTEFPVKLPSAETKWGSKAFQTQSTRLSADDQNKRLRMNSLNYNHVPVAATTDKYSPAELILTFDHMQAIPSESKLNNIFRRFGTLIETETLIHLESCCARVVFKKSSDAEVAVSSAKAFNIMGPSVVKYELCYAPFSSYTAMPAVEMENTTSAMRIAESEVINAREYDPENMPAQQMQFEHPEEAYAENIALEREEYEGLDDVDIME